MQIVFASCYKCRLLSAQSLAHVQWLPIFLNNFNQLIHRTEKGNSVNRMSKGIRVLKTTTMLRLAHCNVHLKQVWLLAGDDTCEINEWKPDFVPEICLIKFCKMIKIKKERESLKYSKHHDSTTAIANKRHSRKSHLPCDNSRNNLSLKHHFVRTSWFNELWSSVESGFRLSSY